ncbi:MAG: CpsD/CapB family tyrosine-protein kinase [Eubacteriales bacterium]
MKTVNEIMNEEINPSPAQTKQRTDPSKRERFIGENLDFASAEAYNLLRANLSFSFSDQETGRIIGITSPCPQEGKSTTSINLAYSIAKSGKRVLLIDADMRRPSVYKTLGLPLSPGLSNWLVEKPSSVTHPGVLHENLSVITSGDIPPNPSELLGSPKMKEILEIVSGRYDFIIVDLPPVLAVPDALVVSKYLDGIIVVVKHKTSKRRDIVDTVRQLRFTKARILGFIYNGYDNTSSGGYKKKNYYKNYYTSSSSSKKTSAK